MSLYSGGAYSEWAYSDFSSVTPGDTAFEAFLARIGVARTLLLEIDAVSLAPSDAITGGYSMAAYSQQPYAGAEAGGESLVQTLRFSSDGFTARDLGLHFDARIKGDPEISRQIVGREGLGGIARVYGDIVLSNADGGLDRLLDDYALDGRAVRLLIGPRDGLYSDFGLVFKGVFNRATLTERDLRISVSDGLAKLELPIQPNVYAGTGGLEGGADLKGKPKPLTWGAVYNITPVLVDAANLIYQVHDGAIDAVSAVRDRGVALTPVGGAPAPGQYQVNAAQGTFTLGAAADGEITCDVRGDAPAAGYTTSTAQIALRILSRALYTSEIDTTAFVNLTTVAGAPVGIHVGAEVRTAAEALDDLLAGIGAFGGFSRAGVFTAGVVGLPTEAEVASYDETQILAIERSGPPAALDPRVWRVVVGWRRNYTVQSDIAALAADADRSFAAELWRNAVSEDAAIRSRHLLAREYRRESCYRDEADAVIEAQRLFELWSTGRGLYRVTLPIEALTADLGDVVIIRHPRFGLANGRQARVLGHAVRGLRVDLTVMV